jgi:hypothetical protein
MRGSTIRGALALGLLFSSAAGAARAQFPQFPAFSPSVNPSQRPIISPYLNLINRGGDPAINYYGLVRPQFNFQNAENLLQREVNVAQQTADLGAQQGIINRNLPPTGHRVGFQTQYRFFQTFNRGAGGGGYGGYAGGYTGAGFGTGLLPTQGAAVTQGGTGFQTDRGGTGRTR